MVPLSFSDSGPHVPPLTAIMEGQAEASSFSIDVPTGEEGWHSQGFTAVNMLSDL